MQGHWQGYLPPQGPPQTYYSHGQQGYNAGATYHHGHPSSAHQDPYYHQYYQQQAYHEAQQAQAYQHLAPPLPHQQAPPPLPPDPGQPNPPPLPPDAPPLEPGWVQQASQHPGYDYQYLTQYQQAPSVNPPQHQAHQGYYHQADQQTQSRPPVQPPLPGTVTHYQPQGHHAQAPPLPGQDQNGHLPSHYQQDSQGALQPNAAYPTVAYGLSHAQQGYGSMPYGQPTQESAMSQGPQYAQQQAQSAQPPLPPDASLASGAVPATPAAAAAVKQSLEALRPVLDATMLLRPPGRARRPRRLLLVLRGLPGSGKSHLAKRIRDVETEEGGDAPRVHSIDEYFITEVEKEVDEEGPRGKPRKRTVLVSEYQYDGSMAGNYQRSLVRAVCKTLEEGRYPLVVMDAPNMKLADFMDVLPATQRHQYATYVLQPLDTDPESCAQRNTHGHSVADIAKMAGEWEPTPGTLELMDARQLFQKRVQGASAIQEVEMDDDTNGTEESNSAAGTRAQGSTETDGVTAGSGALKSRWATGADGGGGGAAEGGAASRDDAAPRARKRSRMLPPSDSDAAILNELSSALASADNKERSASLLAREKEMREAMAAARCALRRRKRVRWCDMPEPDTGSTDGDKEEFRIPVPARPLCRVYVLEDLGPAKGETAVVYMDATSPFLSGRRPGVESFADAVRAEHHSEHDILVALHDGAIKTDEE